MAEILAVGSSVIAIIQITDRIIGLCKFYIETARDAPRDLRFILLETSTLKTTFEHLNFLITCDGEASITVSALCNEDGPIEGCRRAIAELETLFPSDYMQTTEQARSKKQKLKDTLAALAWPLKESKAKKLLGEIMSYKASITLALSTESTQDIKGIKKKTSEIHELLTDSQRHEVYKWLQRTDPSSIHHKSQKHYEPGTGNWMLRSPEWKGWLDAKQRCLWIHGIPGAGKTVLVSYLIEKIREHCGQAQQVKSTFAYYYCYYGHNQDEAVPFLCWLINRLSRELDMVPGHVYKMYRYGGEPSLVELLKALEEILDNYEIIYVVVDAIDESNPREDLLKVFRDLITDPRFKKLQLLASSREYIDIEKVMGNISVPVSMSNPFVEQDIRRHVLSTLRSNLKFRSWPPKLLVEVVYAVSRGANGMFRWAVCQIDALQRLKGERDVVRKALRNLPKTLYETYDRIFLSIPEEDRLFVRHALEWIRYHTQLYAVKSIPCTMLLSGVEKSIGKTNANQNDRFYNNETLRELCGCLIDISENYTDREGKVVHAAPAVSFAHYTVLEYLYSTHISKSSTFYNIGYCADLRECLMEITLSQALHIKPNEPCDQGSVSIDYRYVSRNAYEVFSVYCVVSAFLLLRNWPDEMAQYNALSEIAFALLDPSKPHFEAFLPAGRHVGASDSFLYLYYLDTSCFWEVIWIQIPSETDAAILLNLCLLGHDWSKALVLVKRYLQEKEPKALLQARLTLKASFWITSLTASEDCIFDGSVIEIMAQLASDEAESFSLLMEHGLGLFDPSKLLLLFIGRHSHSAGISHKKYCPLKRLLELGANVNMTEYQITALQIATACWDLGGITTLLEAGANPNDAGNKDGIRWDEGTAMSRFNGLHGASPLHICRNFGYAGSPLAKSDIKAGLESIEAILLKFGAEEFLTEQHVWTKHFDPSVRLSSVHDTQGYDLY